ncbi:MAG: ribosome biosis GTPase / thiamine phosphate phosphatase [Gaiellales bacterium]|nr:ribosome biosis GTPase / thiamine phosphate phosphatase [Gaiellales bacterium]
MTDPTAVLAQLGWDEHRTTELAELGFDLSAAARVVRVDRGHATLRAIHGDLRVATDRLDLVLAVGDWLAMDDEGGVAAVLARRSLLERRTPSESHASPAVAANVDVVCVANALDHSFSARRLERFLLVAWESGARPLVVLTKADAHPAPAAAIEEAEAAALATPVLAVSVRTGEGIDELRAHLAGSTAVLIGRSGAGKSTLVNVLAGAEVAATADVRRDGKGRHTTTHRELHCLAGGGVLIDTPGLRAVLPHDAGLAAERAFGDIEELAAGCRFSDCRHAGEPGCAVAAAVAAGAVAQERFAAWQRAEHDRVSFERRGDAAAARAQRGHYKTLNKSLRAARKKGWV